MDVNENIYVKKKQACASRCFYSEKQKKSLFFGCGCVHIEYVVACAVCVKEAQQALAGFLAGAADSLQPCCHPTHPSLITK